MEKVLQIKNLKKNYGDLQAVKGISFDVKKGEIFGLLGENGAGKTTTLEIVEGLRQKTSGEVKIFGKDIENSLNDIKEDIGVQLQSSAYFDYLTLGEILDLFESFYQEVMDPNELLDMVGLKSKKKSFVQDLSGGQKQRFSIIASLVNNPDLVFLDEPTTGLDPLARRNLWEIIIDIKKRGKTIILTTHYMEEAEKLCDRIAIMEKGEILEMGKTNELIKKVSLPYRIEFVSEKINEKELKKLQGCCGKITQETGKADHYELQIKSRDDMNKALDIIQKNNPKNLSVGEASLEELFIELTGKTITGEEDV